MDNLYHRPLLPRTELESTDSSVAEITQRAGFVDSELLLIMEKCYWFSERWPKRLDRWINLSGVGNAGAETWET